jgi:protein TonB
MKKTSDESHAPAAAFIHRLNAFGITSTWTPAGVEGVVMSLTYAAEQATSPVRKSSTIVIVVLLHAGFFYAFTHGLNVVEIVTPLKDTVAVFIPKESPPPLPLPEPETKPLETPIDNLVPDLPPPIPMDVSPEVSVNVDSGESAITTDVVGTEVAPARSFAIKQRVNPVYPSASRRAGESGTVLLDIVVGPNGAPTEINVERSSGFVALDDAAVAAVRKWRFTVSSDSNYARVRLPVTFKLETVR